MPAVTASAPGKVILFGEHAVVYGRPAIAAPVNEVSIRATIMPAIGRSPGEVHIQAPLIQLDAELKDLPSNHPIALLISLANEHLGVVRMPPFHLIISGTIPIAAGLGSGAAVSVAALRAYTSFLGKPLANADLNALAYEIEKIHHGTPSGIDNTVITYNKPVFFVRDQPIQTFHVKQPFSLVIGDTGIPSPTSITVGGLRERWVRDPGYYEDIFNQVGILTHRARELIESGRPELLGTIMDENQELLNQMGVSCPELDALIHAARQGGALGAKLSGGGGGGNMIALVETSTAEQVQTALIESGARRVILTTIRPLHKEGYHES